MIKYSCEKCGKEFTQKGHYTKHTTKKNPCVFESKIEEMIEKVVAKKINELSSITLNTNTDKKYSVLSLFTGIGGMDMGFGGDVIVHKNSISTDFANNIKCNYEDIDGFVNLIPKMFNVVFQNDILEGAKKVCELNNTHSNYIVKSIYELLSENYNFPKTDIVIGGFPCFVKGTKILTQNGYKNIECVELCDKLLTHTGNFQSILNLQKKIYIGNLFNIDVKYHPDIITCTEEHPFYIREKKKMWNNKLRKYEYIFENPIWKKANELTMCDYFGMPINNNKIVPEFTFEKVINQYKKEQTYIKLDNLDYWFVMGYLIGDGWIEETNKKYGRCMYKIRNNKDEKEVFERINRVLPITDKNCNSGRCKKFGCSDFIWYNILKQFGKYAYGKLIPEWVQDAPKEFIQEFINGYVKADGCISKNNTIRVTTVSYNLAFGLQRLYLKLGHIFAISKRILPKTTTIGGRIVNQRQNYTIKGKIHKEKNMSSFIDTTNNYAWFSPFKINKVKVIEEPVYNFEVENDNSYIVENLCVHNCNDFSHAGKRKGFNSETTHNLKDELTIDNSRGTLYKSFVSVVDKVKPKIFIAENVYGLLTMKDNPINQIISDFSNLGYDVNYELIKANEYGIPQKRWRVIIIGISKNRRINELNINWNLITKNKINCNIGVYFKHLLEPSDTIDISQQSFSKAKKLEKGQGQVEINLNSISPTIRAEHHGNIEFRRHLNGINKNEKELPERRLTIRETGLIQTFPPNFIFNQKKDMTSYKYIGNAVPPLLAYIVADKIEELLLEYF